MLLWDTFTMDFSSIQMLLGEFSNGISSLYISLSLQSQNPTVGEHKIHTGCLGERKVEACSCVLISIINLIVRLFATLYISAVINSVMASGAVKINTTINANEGCFIGLLLEASCVVFLRLRVFL